MSDSLPPDDQRGIDLFFRALEEADPAQRTAFLDRECAGDPILRDWVEAELHRQTRVRESAGNAPSPNSSMNGEPPLTPEIEALLASLKPEEAGERIGVYTLVEQLGEGAFGTVWMAEQERPVRREVALKILKPGMDSREVLRRFAQEQQALAMLDHPGVARVFDAGVTPAGRPFFAMELVRGEPITKYCDAAQLSVRERIELLIRVCHAIQHAHQKGVIHRDLKPTNILVKEIEGGLTVPKVIDLGLAKAIQTLPGGQSLLVTQAELIIGTPLYMSPEQAEGSADIDIRTDIYALGAIFYELLTGRTPHDPDEFSRRALDDLCQAIRVNEPAPPSSLLRSLPESAVGEAAQRRGTEQAHLVRLVRGDLDAICMKALEKDRRNRYASTVQLAADLESHLRDEPISARRPSQWIRAAKFTRRHRVVVFASVVILIAIVAAAVVSTREALRARAAERVAIAARESAARQRQRAVSQRAKAEAERTVARRSEYVANLGLAQQSLNAGNFGQAVQLLEKSRPAPGETDFRGWDWRYLWLLAQGDEHVDFPNLSGPASEVAFSPSGDLLAISGPQESAIFDARTRALVVKLPQGGGQFAFVDGGKLLLTYRAGRISLRRTEDWTEWAAWNEGSRAMALSADGTKMALVVSGGVRIRETATWKQVDFIPDAQGPLALSSDGKMLATTAKKGITVRSLGPGGGEPRVMPDSEGIFDGRGDLFSPPIKPMTFAAGGSMLVARQNTPNEHGVYVLHVWDSRSGTELALLPGDPDQHEHTGSITSIEAAPDGRTVVTTSLDHSVRLWDIVEGRRIAVLHGHHAEVGGCAFSPDGQTLVTCDRAGQVKAWDVNRKDTEDILPDVVRPLEFSADGRTLAALTAKNEVVFYNVARKKRLKRFQLDSARLSREATVDLSADLGLIAEGRQNGSVNLWDTVSGGIRVEHVSNRSVDVLALTPDGHTLVTGGRGEFLRTRDLRTGAEAEFPFRASRIVISPDGRTLAAFMLPDESDAGSKKRAKLALVLEARRMAGALPNETTVGFWDLATQEVLATLPTDAAFILDAAFSNDGKIFATAGSDNDVRLWDPATGELLGVLSGHKQVVTAVAFSPDGQTLASASDDSTLRLWNIAARQEILTIQRLGSRMRGLLFSPDLRTLIVAETSRTGKRQLRFYRAPLLSEIDQPTPSNPANGAPP